MTDSRPVETLEIERKFEVPEGAQIPHPHAFARMGLSAGAPVTHELAAIYYDTRDSRLAGADVAVRSRRGGVDEGWHVKQRTPHGTREFHWPLTPEVPPSLFDTLDELVGDVRGVLEPRVTLDTVRTMVLLHDEQGSSVVELADDRVCSMDHRESTARAWREWEGELVPGADPEVLEKVAEVLQAAGASPSLSIAKVARASGQLIDLAIQGGATAADLATVTLIDLADRLAAGEDARCASLRQIAGRIGAEPA